MKTHTDSLNSLPRPRFRSIDLLTCAALRGLILILVATSFHSISHAGLIFSFNEVNGDVVMQASGSINTSLLVSVGPAGWGGTGVESSQLDIMGSDLGGIDTGFRFSPGTDFSAWNVSTGPFGASHFSWSIVTGTTSFTTYIDFGGQQPGLGVNGAQIVGGVWTPDNVWTYSSSTFSSLSLNPGTYTVTDIVTGASITFAVGPQGPPPEELSAQTTGLPMANALGQMLISGNQTVTGDINNHLFSLMAGDGEEAANSGGIAADIDYGVTMGFGDGPDDAQIAKKVLRSRQWEVFTTVNYGYVDLNALGGQAGVKVESWAPGIGIERHLSRGLAVGFAVSFLQSWQDYSGGLGNLDLEGPALSAYLTFVRKNYWSSLLYSFGSYEMDSTRNPGFGFPQAYGSTRTYTNAVQYNTGWNFRFQNNTLVTGPFAGIDYLHGSVDAYSETGGGLAALRYNQQSYESLVTRIGWGVSKKIKTDFATITPQVRLSYERQNLTNNGTSVSLITAPFTAAGGNQSPGQDYLVAGTGVNFAFNDQLSLLLTYQGQFFRSDMAAHFGGVKLSYAF